MIIKKIAGPVFEHYDLLQHPFYKAWNDGRLTKEQVALYAQEYGGFIELIAEGWKNIGHELIADEEEQHYLLWKDFATSLHCPRFNVMIPEVNDLVLTCKKYFENYVTSIGALYAFEAQQPDTTATKLQGLQTHYCSWKANDQYFVIHANDAGEPRFLETEFNGLSAEERIVAENACAETCRLLWRALSGIMEHGMINSAN